MGKIKTLEHKDTYILDRTNNLIHFYRCSKVGADFERFDADKFPEVYLKGNYNTCENCYKLNSRGLQEDLRVMIGSIIAMCLVSTLASIYKVRGQSSLKQSVLWVESPNGYKAKMLYYDALRVIRKHDWKLAEVEPIKPELTKWQMIKKIIGVGK